MNLSFFSREILSGLADNLPDHVRPAQKNQLVGKTIETLLSVDKSAPQGTSYRFLADALLEQGKGCRALLPFPVAHPQHWQDRENSLNTAPSRALLRDAEADIYTIAHAVNLSRNGAASSIIAPQLSLNVCYGSFIDILPFLSRLPQIRFLHHDKASNFLDHPFVEGFIPYLTHALRAADLSCCTGVVTLCRHIQTTFDNRANEQRVRSLTEKVVRPLSKDSTTASLAHATLALL